ncbi:hypothetical protein HMPREF1143_2202 [Peptoanaerobacter stomatis]|uniref:Uncharacterized protein n=1 Tax=Peptoanaerobacter stomatis TaxID=796937 RepID=J5ULA0_9FIRM|nr:hypothetical protein [Peptoanaerobacter stomatis]EJU23409.1 hypothetical protein HMPREF1143_2202 [Peptoanaerobacter stomatis]NWO24327.1 hypothetical protein [Peptostreptococcaceae bacterium oral taxon 081]
MKIKMQSIKNSELFIMFILLANLLIITIPYSIKNIKIRQQINNVQILETKNNESIDFYKIYKDFNDILNKLDLNITYKNSTISQNSMTINIKFHSNINMLTNLLAYIHKNIPNMSIISANIENDTKGESEITFYIENQH